MNCLYKFRELYARIYSCKCGNDIPVAISNRKYLLFNGSRIYSCNCRGDSGSRPNFPAGRLYSLDSFIKIYYTFIDTCMNNTTVEIYSRV